MRTLLKIAWRNLFRQRRRTAITVAAMALSLVIAIPYYGLVEGLSHAMLRGITRMELGHVQIHDASIRADAPCRAPCAAPSACCGSCVPHRAWSPPLRACTAARWRRTT